MVTNYPKKEDGDPRRHPWGPIKRRSKALSESTSREATNHGKKVKKDTIQSS
jgi:hypothetical protein